MTRLLLVIATLLVSIFSFAAQDDAESWTILSVTPVDSIMHGGYTGYVGSYQLSPDDSALAWIAERNLCLYFRLSKVTRCYRAPHEVWRLRWSPDGNAILITSGYNFYATLQVFDLRSERFTLLEGGYRVSASAFWSGSGDTVYFLSGGFRADTEKMPFLVAYSVQTQTYTRTDLRGIFPPLSMSDVKLEAVSPQGERLIVSVPYEYDGEPSIGLWLINLDTRQLKQIAPMRELYSMLPDGYYQPSNADIMDVYWNQARGVLWVMIGRGLPSRPIGVVSIDLETFQQTPVVPVRFYSETGTDQGSILPYPSGRITPDGALFFFHQEDSPDKWYMASIYAIPLDSPAAEPLLVVAGVTPDCLPEFVLAAVEHRQRVRAYLADYSDFCPG